MRPILALLALLMPMLVQAQTATDALRIGVLAYRGTERALRDWQPHADYLNKRLAPRRFEIVPLSLSDFSAAIAERRIDVFITNPGHYVHLETGGQVARIATMRVTGPHGPVDRLGGVAIVRAERKDLQSYADLKGKRVLVPDLKAFGGLQMHLPHAKAAGIDLRHDTAELIALQSHDKIVEGVLAGAGDAGFIRSGVLESLIAAGKLDAKSIRVIQPRSTPGFPYAHSTALYPQWPFARLDHVSEELTKDILIALLELPPDHPAARAAEIHGWTLPHNYQAIHDLFLEFRLGPYEDLPIRLEDVIGRYGKAGLIIATAVIALLLTALLGILRSRQALQRSQQRLQLAAKVFEHAQEGILVTDAAGNIIEVNDSFLELTGYRREEVTGRNPRFLASGRHGKEFFAEMWRVLQEQGYWRGELWNKRKDGREYVQRTSISALRDSDGRTTHFIGLSSDVTAIKESEARLEQMAYLDALTNLPNRRMLTDRLYQAIAQADRNQTLLAVCYIDLDGFKPVNDRWGHAVGDRLLIETAQRLLSCVRAGDTVSRLGGDEFVVLLTNLQNYDECTTVVDRLRATLVAPYPLPEGEARMSASIGITLYPVDHSDPDALIRHADQAMYAAKQAGRNCHTLFDPAEDKVSEARKESRQEIRRAIERDEFVIYYQPRVNMHSGEVIGVEALIRWQHPERGLLAPDEFLPVVIFVGLQHEVGNWVLRTVLRQMEVWRMQGLDLVVGVNIDPQQLQREDFPDRLRGLLAQHPTLPADRLELEILETTALEDLTRVSSVIDACRSLGVRFAIDDFGTGYSSLTYLKQIKADALKIDRSFIRDMIEDPDDLAIVDSVVGLATAFRLEVIAEGVESVEIGQLLLRLGCDMGQGYGIARPMPAESLPDWLANWSQPPEWRNVAAWPRPVARVGQA